MAEATSVTAMLQGSVGHLLNQAILEIQRNCGHLSVLPWRQNDEAVKLPVTNADTGLPAVGDWFPVSSGECWLEGD